LLDAKAHQTAGQDGDEGDLDKSDEMRLCPLEDRVQPAVATYPRQRARDDSANSF
jgi:hypothetical protein